MFCFVLIISMRKISICLSIILLISLNLKAQSDFRPGYLVKNNGDTLTGLIDYKGIQANARKCVFKLSNDSPEEKFTPDDIKAYRFIDSKYYVSRRVMTEDSTELQLFLEYLIDGIVDVFYYRDITDENYLVDDGEGHLLLVKDKNDVIVVDNVAYANEMKRYKGILAYVFRRSPAICKEIDRMILDHKSIINIAKEYHEEVCTDQDCIIFEKKPQKAILSVSPVAGISIDFLKIKNRLKENYYFLEGSNFNASVFPEIGIIFTLKVPLFNERFGINLCPELGYRKFETRNQGYLSGNKVVYDISFSQFNLANSLFISYSIPFNKINLFGLAGIRSNYHFKNEYSRKVIEENGNILEEYTQYPFNRLVYCPYLGAGISIALKNSGTFTLDASMYQDLSSGGVLFEKGILFRIGYRF